MSQDQRMFKILCMLSVGILVGSSVVAMDDKRIKRSDRRFTMDARKTVDEANFQQASKKDHPIKQDPDHLARIVRNHEQKKHYDDYTVSPVKQPSQINIFDRHQSMAFDKSLATRNQKNKKVQEEATRKAVAKEAKASREEKKAQKFDKQLEERNMQLNAKFAALDEYDLLESWTQEQQSKQKNNPALAVKSETIKAEDLSSLPLNLYAEIGLESGSEESNKDLSIVINDFDNVVALDVDDEKENRGVSLAYSATKPVLLRTDDNKLSRMQHRLRIAQDNRQFTGRLPLERHEKELARDTHKNR